MQEVDVYMNPFEKVLQEFVKEYPDIAVFILISFIMFGIGLRIHQYYKKYQ